jgi:hypothetical protein
MPHAIASMEEFVSNPAAAGLGFTPLAAAGAEVAATDGHKALSLPSYHSP